jgi:transcriptional regulator with XRE-family HTH domain
MVERGRSVTYAAVIAIRIRKLCEQKGITLNKLATLSGIRQSTLENIIKGKSKSPTLKTLHRIAIGFDMTISELLDFKEMNETIFDNE